MDCCRVPEADEAKFSALFVGGPFSGEIVHTRLDEVIVPRDDRTGQYRREKNVDGLPLYRWHQEMAERCQVCPRLQLTDASDSVKGASPGPSY